MARKLVFLLAAAMLLGPGLAAAQAPVQIAGAEDVNILADHLEEIGPANLLVATGNVEVTRGGNRILADRVEINRSTGDAVATGHVILYDGNDRLSGPRLDYNLKDGTGVLYEGRAQSEPYYRLTGERMERIDESLYRIYRGKFSTCEDEPPLWSIHMDRATADFDSMLFGRNASVWVKDIAVIPWVPVFATALGRPRQTGFLPPTFGSSTLRGYFAKVPFYWAISDSQDFTVSLDAYSKLGVGADAQYRYLLGQGTQGSAAGFFVDETAVHGDLRGYFHWLHTSQIDPTTALKIDINHTSDNQVFRQYADTLYERSLQRAESDIFLSRRMGLWNFVGNAQFYQDLTTLHPTELQRLPDLRLTRNREALPGLPWALWDLESSATYFVRDAGSEGGRLDVHPRVTAPFRPFGLFTIAPFVGGRSTTYTQEVNGQKTLYAEQIPVETTEDALRTRVLGEAGADLETRATRVYLVDAGGIASVLHSIEPRVNYTFTDGINKDRNPQWDSIDALGRLNTWTYSLTNRVTAKTVAGPDEQPTRWELARLVVGQSYDANLGQRALSDIGGDLIVDPTRYFRLRSTSTYSIYNRAVLRSLTTDFGLLLTDFTGTVGYRYQRPEAAAPLLGPTLASQVPVLTGVASSSVNFLQAEGTLRLSQWLTLRGSTYWDVRSAVFVENRIGADIRFQCWGLSFTYVNRARDSVLSPTGAPSSTADNEFRFTVNLLGVGPIGARAGFQ